MLIITNCMTETSDEGCLKVAVSLVKRLKKAYQDNATVISYERKSELSDIFMNLNPMFLNSSLLRKVKKQKDILFIPFGSNTLASAVKLCVLSLFCKGEVTAIFALRHPMNFLTKLLLKLSRTRIVTLSRDSYEFYFEFLGDRVEYLKVGVDTKRFVPVTAEKSCELKIKYGFEPQKNLVLHVGHLNSGRNVEELSKISDEYSVLLVTSTLTKAEQDIEIKNKLINLGVKIFDFYIPEIEEIFQMCDAYFFPVIKQEHCIDVPLSCMEAAACNKPVITTNYGEMKEVITKEGFYLIESFEEENINSLLKKAIENKAETRAVALKYDWDNALDFFKF